MFIPLSYSFCTKEKIIRTLKYVSFFYHPFSSCWLYPFALKYTKQVLKFFQFFIVPQRGPWKGFFFRPLSCASHKGDCTPLKKEPFETITRSCFPMRQAFTKEGSVSWPLYAEPSFVKAFKRRIGKQL